MFFPGITAHPLNPMTSNTIHLNMRRMIASLLDFRKEYRLNRQDAKEFATGNV